MYLYFLSVKIFPGDRLQKELHPVVKYFILNKQIQRAVTKLSRQFC